MTTIPSTPNTSRASPGARAAALLIALLLAIGLMLLSGSARAETTILTPSSPAPENAEGSSGADAPTMGAPTMGVAAAEATSLPNGAFIDNGTVRLGVRNDGALIYGDYWPEYTGLSYLPTGADVLTPGGWYEGWGAGDSMTRVSGAGYSSGTWGANVVDFSSTPSTAKSVVRIGDTLEVTHHYQPSAASGNLYEATVTIKNISASPVEPRYTRVMDWDVPPTVFQEYVTIHRGTSPNVLFSSNYGFAYPDPFGGHYAFEPAAYDRDFTDLGPYDQGALFDFGFDRLAPNESVEFKIFYGAAGNEGDAMSALSAAGAEVYSLAQPATDPTGGTPNTFVFGFSAHTTQPNEPPTVDAGGPYAVDEGASVAVAATGSDPEGKALTYAWDLDNDGAFDDATGQSATFEGVDGPAAKTIAVQATDEQGARATDEATVDVKNVAPTIGPLRLTGNTGIASIGGNEVGLGFAFSDPAGSNDEYAGTIDWGDGHTDPFTTSPVDASHNYGAGAYTITVRVSDGDGGVATDTASVSRLYRASAILAPINGDGSSVFKSGATIPVKVKITDRDNNPVGAGLVKPKVLWGLGSSATPEQAVNETATSTSGADTGNYMRYDEASQQWIFNLATKSLGGDQNAKYWIVVRDENKDASGTVLPARFGPEPSQNVGVRTK